MMRFAALAVVTALAWVAGTAREAADRRSDAVPRVSVGVVVEETARRSPALRDAARAEVAALGARGFPAELRIVRSPSEALASAATLATRGAERLVLVGVDPAVVATLRRKLTGVRLEPRRRPAATAHRR